RLLPNVLIRTFSTRDWVLSIPPLGHRMFAAVRRCSFFSLPAVAPGVAAGVADCVWGQQPESLAKSMLLRVVGPWGERKRPSRGLRTTRNTPLPENVPGGPLFDTAKFPPGIAFAQRMGRTN